MEIEREVVDLHRALYMKDHIGENYAGTVTSVVGSGLYVNLDKPFVDVLVRLESLGTDSYQLDDEGLRVIGTRSGDRIALGDSMMIRVDDVNIARRTVFARRVLGDDDRVQPRPKRATKKSGRTEKPVERRGGKPFKKKTKKRR
jgi:ribonuclease R